jgi:tRNA G18 (ribose-2'-O)-methylase SpoU
MKKKTIWDLHRMTVEECRQAEKLPLVMVLDNVRSLSNIGAIFRTCDAFRVVSIALCGVSGTPPSVEIHKTALGAEDSVPWMHFDDTMDAIAYLRERGYRICALEQVEGSIPLQNFVVEPGQPYAIIAGHEVKGVAQEVVDAADCCIEIPQFGSKHSLNVSVSAGIALWHIFSNMQFPK